MSVAEVRKALGEVRKRASLQTATRPVYITDLLTDRLSIQEFCLRFVCGHHEKRHFKSSKKRKNIEGDDDNDSDDENDDDDDQNEDVEV
jgi:hypothetical protein